MKPSLLLQTFFILAVTGFISTPTSFALQVANTDGTVSAIPQERILSALLLGGIAYNFYHQGGPIIARKYALEYVPGLKKAAFELSLLDVLRRTKEPILGRNENNDRWNVIYQNEKGAKVILGMIPLLEHEHHLKLKNEYKVEAVVSLLENFELQPGWFKTPVSTEVWQSLKVHHHQVATADFNPLSIQSIKDTVGLINFYLYSGRTIYIHCKAGVGRSATAVAAWLAQDKLYDFKSDISEGYLKWIVEGVVDEINNIRTVNLGDTQKEAILKYLKWWLPPHLKTSLAP